MQSLTKSAMRYVASWMALMMVGCTGVIGEAFEHEAPGSSSIENPSALPSPEADGDATGAPMEAPLQTPRVNRLTHEQWSRSAHAILALEYDPEIKTMLIRDTLSGVVPVATDLRVGQTLFDDYQRAAELLAKRFVENHEAFAKRVPEDGEDLDRALTFIRESGRRAYRRPLDATEEASLLTLFEDVAASTDFRTGIEVLVRMFLQSPNFIYRPEIGEDSEGEFEALGPYSLATRLSLFVWNQGPDDALLDAAESGELTASIETYQSHVTRLLDDPKARSVLALLYEEVFGSHGKTIIRDPEVYPNFSADLGESASVEQSMWSDEVLFSREGTFVELFGAPETFVDDKLARIYGLPEIGEEGFRLVDLDATKRAGLLTQIGFLATHGESDLTDAIHRGVFVNERVLCRPVGAPPADAVIPDATLEPGLTTREAISQITGSGTCGGCHNTLINPMGFPFERFDAIGGFKETEYGLPIDARTDLTIDGTPREVDGAREFAEAIIHSEEFHRCQSGHWVSYALGVERKSVANSNGLVANLSTASAGGASIRELVEHILTSPAFTYRQREGL